MKIIEVYDPQNVKHEVLVDDEDYPELMKYSWTWRNGYAATRMGRTYYQLHRMVMGVLFREQVIVDHKNNNHHDCQKHNLRRADRFQNQQNRKTNVNATLPKGIRQLPSGKYNVRVQGWNKRYVFGAYDTQEEAVAARNAFAKELHKEFFNPSYLNDPASNEAAFD